MKYSYFQIIVSLLSKIKRVFRYKSMDVVAMLGLDKQFFRKARGARMLIYHGICQKDHTRFNPIFLTRKTFEEHLKFYAEYFNLVSLYEFYSGQFSNDRFNVCITFDDGYANNFKYVLPLMEKYKAPISFFITAIRKAGYNILWNDFLGIVTKYGPTTLTYDNIQFGKDRSGRYAAKLTGMTLVEYLKENGFERKEEMMKQLHQLFPLNTGEEDYWMQMSEDQILTLASSSLATIGSHGFYHNRMDNLSVPEAIDEMKTSKGYLEKLTGKQITALAFPYGNYSRTLVEEAKKIGYNQLLAMDFFYPEDKHDPSLRERFTVNPFISVNNQMHATVVGRYE